MAATDAVLLRKFAGIRNDVPVEALSETDLALAVNVDIDNDGGIERRSGYALKLAASAPHSGFGTGDGRMFLFVEGASLKSLDPSMTSATTLRSDLTPGLLMGYWERMGRVYYSNGEQTGVVEAGVSRTWGLVPPATPEVAVTAGTLPQGRYLVTCTFVATDGQESGAPESVAVDLEAGNAIVVSLPDSMDPRVGYVTVYCSTANGSQLYEAGRYAIGTASATVSPDTIQLQRPLLTHMLREAPAGQLCAMYRGRMYVARDNLLFASKAFSPELFDPVEFLAFGDTITLVAPARDGIFVGTSTETVWLGGTQLENFSQNPIQGFGAVPGTLVYYPVGRVPDTQEEILAPMWLSTQGIVTGMPGGQLVNRSQKWNFTAPPRGAGLFRRTGALYQYLVTFSGA